MKVTRLLPVLAVACGITLSACGGSTPSATTATTAAASTATSATVAGAKVDANKATQAELTQALTAAGVSSASRWAREIEEYRPYPTSDPSLAKLKQNLAKYNPSADDVAKIISVLSV
jgi:competence protein ComEA